MIMRMRRRMWWWWSHVRSGLRARLHGQFFSLAADFLLSFPFSVVLYSLFRIASLYPCCFLSTSACCSCHPNCFTYSTRSRSRLRARLHGEHCDGDEDHEDDTFLLSCSPPVVLFHPSLFILLCVLHIQLALDLAFELGCMVSVNMMVMMVMMVMMMVMMMIVRRRLFSVPFYRLFPFSLVVFLSPLSCFFHLILFCFLLSPHRFLLLVVVLNVCNVFSRIGVLFFLASSSSSSLLSFCFVYLALLLLFWLLLSFLPSFLQLWCWVCVFSHIGAVFWDGLQSSQLSLPLPLHHLLSPLYACFYSCLILLHYVVSFCFISSFLQLWCWVCAFSRIGALLRDVPHSSQLSLPLPLHHLPSLPYHPLQLPHLPHQPCLPLPHYCI